jgi:hypothetical protein
MKPHRLVLVPVLGLALCLFVASTAQAQRSFVSAANGNDANPCSRSSPCRSFDTAINAVGAGGEVVALDSGGYGPIYISKSITITAPPGVYAAIAVTGPGDAVDIYAGASDIVVLRGLTLTGGNAGIFWSTGGTVQVEDCVLSGGGGITANGAGRITVSHTVVRNSSSGVSISPPSGATAVGTVSHCRFDNINQAAVSVTSSDASTTALASVEDCVATASFGTTLRADSYGGRAELNVDRCIVTNSGYGLGASVFSGNGPAIVRVSDTTVTHCSIQGIVGFGAGQTLSRGNNTVEGNASNGSFTGAFSAK